MGYRYRVPSYSILSQDEIRQIHEASLEILAEIGVRVPNRRIIGLASDFGAHVDKTQEIVKLPPELVSRAIAQAGKQHVLYGTDRTKMAEFGCGMFNFNGSSGQHQIVDGSDRQRRSPTVEDLRKAIAVGEGLETVNITGPLVVPSDVADGTADLVIFKELLCGTTKPFAAWVFSGESASIVIEMMRLVAGGSGNLRNYPFFETFIEPVSPLSFRQESLEILCQFVDAGLPVGISPMVQAGATGPCTLAGTLALENAEVLAGIALVQLLARGHPVTYGGIPHIFDMKVGGISFGSPEQALLSAAATQLGRHYGFPVYTNAGLSDSKALDAQYGIECSATLAFAGLAHADIFGHLGICGADSAADIVQLVVDDELAAYFVRAFSGLTVSARTLAIEEVRKEGIGGSFLSNELTAENYRREFWFPRIMDRSSWDAWKTQRAKDIAQRARERAGQLLAQERPPAIEDKLVLELGRLITGKGGMW